jgi:hypothetical protein
MLYSNNPRQAVFGAAEGGGKEGGRRGHLCCSMRRIAVAAGSARDITNDKQCQSDANANQVPIRKINISTS